MTEKDAINLILEEGGGTSPVSSTADANAAGPKRFLDRARTEILAKGYPFNTDTVDLLQDSGTHKVPVASEYLKLYLPAPFVVREAFIWDPDNNTDVLNRDFIGTKTVKLIDFVDLGQEEAEAIAWRAAERWAASKKGRGNPQVDHCQQQANRASVALSLKYPVQFSSVYGSAQSILVASQPVGFYRWVSLPY